MRQGGKNQHKILIGKWGIWPLRFPFHLDTVKLNTHKRILGISGQGKSKLLAHYTASLIAKDIPCMLLDPHQDLAEDVLLLLWQWGYFRQSEAFEKLLFIDFSRQDRFLPFNYLVAPFDMYIIARNMVEVCTRVWPSLGDGGGPLFEEIMLASVVVLVANSLPLTALPYLLTDPPFRQKLLATPGVSAQAIRFFTKEYDLWRDQAQMIGSTMRRVFTLTFGPTLLYSLGQQENSLNFKELINTGKSVIVNLHGLDEETQKLLGCLITVGMEQATISRTDIRLPYHFVIDEFASFSTKNGEAYSKFLSQARKFNVFLAISHQTNSQLEESLLKAVGNIQTEIFFRLSHDDALYEAPRLFEHDPYKIKAEVEDEEVREKHVPVFFPLTEHIDAKTWTLKYLRPRHVYVKYSRNPSLFRRVVLKTKPIGLRKLKVVPVQVVKNPEALEKIKNYYAERYMRSADEITKRVFSPLQPASPVLIPSRGSY